MIQKAWGFYLRRKSILKEKNFEDYHLLDSSVIVKVKKIQAWYRTYKPLFRIFSAIKRKVQTVYYGNKILNNIRWLKKRKRTYQKFTDEEQKEIEGFYRDKLEKVKIIQKFFTEMFKPIKTLKKLRLIHSYPSGQKSVYQTHRKILKATSSTDTELVRRIGYCKIEVSMMDKYLGEEQENFEKNWEDYEGKLMDYLLKERKYEDWVQTTTDSGDPIWVNHKTLKKSKKHPGLKVNKAKLKKEAQEEQLRQIGVVEKRRKRFVEIMGVLMKHRGQEMKRIRGEIYKKL